MSNIFINDSILLVPNSIKKDVLIELSTLKENYNIKLLSLEEFIKNITFSYDEKAFIYLINNYDLTYEMAKYILYNLKYLNSNYKNSKLNKMLKIKADLDKNDLLIYDELFLKLIKNKKIIVYGYNNISKFDLEILKKYNAKIIRKENNNYEHDIYEFNTINDELEFVFEKICELINKGVSINNIKLGNVNEEYNSILKRMSNFYNININYKNKISIYSSLIVKDFLDNLNEDINVSLNYLSDKYDLENENNLYIYNKLLKLLNKYYFVTDYTKIKDILIYELKKIYFKSIKYKNAVEIIDIKNAIVKDEDYVFLISFNNEDIPKTYKDEEYLSDKDKEELGIETSLELNKYERNNILTFIKNTKNMFITYKKTSPLNTFTPSNLIDDLDYEINVNLKPKMIYSNLNNKLNLSKDLDNYIKYNTISERLEKLYGSYNLDYRKFNNEYTKIDSKLLEDYLNNKLILSYSSMNDFYKCKFRYYIKNILKIDKFEETFDTIVGNLFHKILSICFENNFDFDESFNEYISKYEFNNQEKFYINKLKKDLKLIIDTIKKQYTHMSFDNALYEEEFYINFDGNIKITFKGFIDKILYKKEETKTYLIIVDYKTGKDEINIENSIYGLNLQLPVYLYLAKNTNKLKNVEVLGFYLQKLLDSPSKEKNKSIDEVKINNLKLQGYSINDENLLSIIDDEYEDSSVVKALKTTKEGFYKNSKLLSKKQIDSLYSLTDSKIKEAINSIREADFKINPKKIGDKLIGCEYCKYKDICFRKNEDIVTLEKQNDLSFL